MIHLNIEPAYKELELEDLLSIAAQTALVHGGGDKSDLTLVITSDKELRKLNKQFRGIDQATDVLAFPSETGPESAHRYLGDVIISLARARSQAKAAGHALSEELQLLTVHGVLHLLGHEHGEPGKKAKMWATQEKILHELGVTIDVDKVVTAHSES